MVKILIINLKNIEVTLYEVTENGELQLAELATLKEEKPTATDAEVNDPNDYTRRTNPTLTDQNGYYEFRGVDVMKKIYNLQKKESILIYRI